MQRINELNKEPKNLMVGSNVIMYNAYTLGNRYFIFW